MNRLPLLIRAGRGYVGGLAILLPGQSGLPALGQSAGDRNTLQRIENERQNVGLAEEVYRVTQLEFWEGVGTSTDVVNAETALRQAQTTYITTLLDLYTARLDLERAKGNILPYLTNR